MSSRLAINPEDLEDSQDTGIGYAIESAAVGCVSKYLRTGPGGSINSYVDTDKRFIGHDMLWLIEATSESAIHLGRQFTIRNAEWPEKYLHVIRQGPGRYKLECKALEVENDDRTHFFLVRLELERNALAIGSVGSPGIYIQMDRDSGKEDGESGVADCHLGTSVSTWFYLLQVNL